EPMAVSKGDITQLLNKWLSGDEEARSLLFDTVYDSLRGMAKRYMARENPGHTLRPTALVNEAYVKIQAYSPKQWESRAHFYAVFARTMRQILVDHARAKLTDKRGGGYQRVSLEDAGDIPEKYYVTLIELDTLLDQLTQDHPLASSVFHLKHFIGLTADEIATVLKMNVTKVNRTLRYAKLWLQRALKSDENSLTSMEYPQEPAL
ncbi:MAG TPA: ECF-type sigma factor, partial [Pyrinomonadaceae bacterium]|nr:ECF-type sigma factor [Pyrinomonadaceae bacterium]